MVIARPRLRIPRAGGVLGSMMRPLPDDHPVMDELAKQYAGKLKCYKLNTDESASIAIRYGIRSIPTVIVFKSGEKKDAVIRAVPKSTLSSRIEKFL